MSPHDIPALTPPFRLTEPKAVPAGWPPDVVPGGVIYSADINRIKASVYAWPGDVDAQGHKLSNAVFAAPVASGPFKITPGASGESDMVLTGPGAAYAYRWRITKDATAESGSNAGSNFAITRYSDAGAVLGIPVFINRASGNIGLGTGNGNVGIGTANPTDKLDVVGTVRARGGLSLWAANSANMLWYQATNQMQLLTIGPDAATNGTLALLTGRSDASNIIYGLTMVANGSIGIGTQLPGSEGAAARLAVVGAAGQNAANITESNTKAVATFRGNASSGWALNIGTMGGGNDNPYLQGAVSNGGGVASNLHLQPFGGNVGIGMALVSTRAPLHVRVAADANFLVKTAVAVGGSVVLEAANDAYSANTPLEIRTSYTAWPIGGVSIGQGIGPSRKLHVFDTSGVTQLALGGSSTAGSKTGIIHIVDTTELMQAYVINGGSRWDYKIDFFGVTAFQVSSNNTIVIPNLPSANPGAGSKQLWFDPADGNRVKFAV